MSQWLESSLTSVRKLADEAVGRIFPTDKKSDQRIEQLEKYVRKALENIPFEMYLFAGTAILYCASRRLLRNNDNNNDSSSPSNDTRRQLTAEELEWEAIIHAQKKQSNYKDPSLQAVMSAMSETKKKLRQVENPEEARKQKLKTLKVQAKSKATTALGISEESLQGKLSSLKKSKRIPAILPKRATPPTRI